MLGHLIKRLKQQDVWLHFVGGIGICIIMSALLNPYVGIGSVVIVAVGKELHDKYIKGTFIDVLDIVMTVLGGLLVFIGLMGV